MKVKFSERLFNVCNVIFLGLFSLIMLYPLWSVLMTSLINQEEFYRRALILWPEDITLLSYQLLFTAKQFANAFKVTGIVTLLGTLFSMFLTVTLAYGLSRSNYPGKKLFMVLIVVTMYFYGGLIPEFILVTRTLNLKGNILAMILPGAAVSAFYVIVLRTFFNTIPKEMEESAKMDGAKEYTILARIILPLSLPAIAALSLFYGVERWNEWFKCLLYINNEKLYTLQVLVRRFADDKNMQAMSSEMLMGLRRNGQNVDSIFVAGVRMASVVVATVPILLVYPLLQKYFAKGVMIGSLKG